MNLEIVCTQFTFRMIKILLEAMNLVVRITVEGR